MATSHAIKDGNANFVLLDSVNAMLLYHDPEMVKNFISFFAEKMRSLNILTVFISIDDNASKKFNPFLEKVCDYSIKI